MCIEVLPNQRAVLVVDTTYILLVRVVNRAHVGSEIALSRLRESVDDLSVVFKSLLELPVLER